jgi:hypothetical protein
VTTILKSNFHFHMQASTLIDTRAGPSTSGGNSTTHGRGSAGKSPSKKAGSSSSGGGSTTPEETERNLAKQLDIEPGKLAMIKTLMLSYLAQKPTN